MQLVTVIGGGLAGLIAAVEVAERGNPVRVLEARSRLGGRGGSLAGPYAANLGPHALYAPGALWDWLDARGLAQPSSRPSPSGLRFRWQGELRRMPAVLLQATRVLRSARREGAPVDRSFRDWVAESAGDEAAVALSGLAGVVTFDHDPGRLSAAFVWERVQRILLQPRPPARYVHGGWGALVDRLEAHAVSRGVAVELGAKVDDLAEVEAAGPTIVAVDPGAARRLLDDPSLQPESPRLAFLDVALTSRRGDPYFLADLDEAAFATRVTKVVPSLAPQGEELVQLSIGMRPDEGLDAAVRRAEAVFDLAYPAWRDRTTWTRRATLRESTGAIDLPGTTWRDRTPVAHGSGVWLAGDWVAAPGHLAEVSCSSAVAAAAAACGNPLPVGASQ
jgi:phytoene dehydrogenase-like protein